MPYDVHGNPIQVRTELEPFGDRLVIKPVEESDRTLGGLYKPDVARDKPQQGDVIAAGPGRLTESGELVPMRVRVGDRVLYGKYSGTEIDVDGVPHLVIRETDVLARVLTLHGYAVDFPIPAAAAA